jgi:hypothetical protein
MKRIHPLEENLSKKQLGYEQLSQPLAVLWQQFLTTFSKKIIG